MHLVQNDIRGTSIVTFGEKLRAVRKEKGLTQKELSKISGVAVITIHQYETGKRNPHLEQLIMLAKALNVSLNSLSDDYAVSALFSKMEDDIQDKVCRHFTESELLVIREMAVLSLANYNNPRPSAFIPSKEQIKTLESIISEIE